LVGQPRAVIDEVADGDPVSNVFNTPDMIGVVVRDEEIIDLY
jgi:hypothetical protein